MKRETTPKPIQSVEPRLIESKNPKITLRLVSKFFPKKISGKNSEKKILSRKISRSLIIKFL